MKQPKKGENNFLLIVRSIFLLCICGILIIVTQDEINKEVTTKKFIYHKFTFTFFFFFFKSVCPPPPPCFVNPGYTNVSLFFFALVVRSIFLLCICGILIIVTQDEINKEVTTKNSYILQ